RQPLAAPPRILHRVGYTRELGAERPTLEPEPLRHLLELAEPDLLDPPHHLAQVHHRFGQLPAAFAIERDREVAIAAPEIALAPEGAEALGELLTLESAALDLRRVEALVEERFRREPVLWAEEGVERFARSWPVGEPLEDFGRRRLAAARRPTRPLGV